TGAGNLNFVSLLYTGNLRQSTRNEVSNSLSIEDPDDVGALGIPGPVSLCVKSTDTIAASLQGWDNEDGPDGIFNNSNSDKGWLFGDEPLDGVTLALSGPNFSPGTYIKSSDDLQVTFTVTVNTDSDNDGLSDCAEKVIGTLPKDPDSDNDGLNDG